MTPRNNLDLANENENENEVAVQESIVRDEENGDYEATMNTDSDSESPSEQSGRSWVLSELRQLSGLASNQNEQKTDDGIMARIIKDVGSHGYGLQAVSVWLFNDENDTLVPRGWWHSPSMPKSKALRRLVDPAQAGYIPRQPVLPGADMVGLLWNDSARDDMAGEESPPMEGDSLEVLMWRDIKSLVVNPYHAKGPRLALLEEAGFYQASGVTFKNDICQGIVVYFIERDLDQATLNGLANTSYLKQSTQMIGSCASMVKTRRATVGHTMKRDVFPQDKMVRIKQKQCPLVPRRIKKLPTKISGGGMQIPPAPQYTHAMWTVLGAFCGLLVLSSLNLYYQYISSDELFLIIGPFGALMTLQYGLTAAPASQPRNAIFGQAVAGAVSMAITHIPESILPVWLRIAVGPAIAIGVMVKCGVPHPPAGAHAVLYATGKYSWALYGLVVLSTAISVIPAVIVNNLSNKRQYPTYWFGGFPKWSKTLFKKAKRLSSKDRSGKKYPPSLDGEHLQGDKTRTCSFGSEGEHSCEKTRSPSLGSDEEV